MAKFTKRQTVDELEFLKYKCEVLERRLDNIETMLFSGKAHATDSSMNGEVMQFLLSMLKQQVGAPSQVQNSAQATSSQQEYSGAVCTQQQKEKNEELKAFQTGIQRRTFGI